MVLEFYEKSQGGIFLGVEGRFWKILSVKVGPTKPHSKGRSFYLLHIKV